MAVLLGPWPAVASPVEADVEHAFAHVGRLEQVSDAHLRGHGLVFQRIPGAASCG